VPMGVPQLVELDSEDEPIGAERKLCGGDVPAAWSSTGGRVQVTFRTNRRVNGVGFSLNFTAGWSMLQCFMQIPEHWGNGN